jgi:hypothetical protein
LIISGIEYFFFFDFTYYSGRINYPCLIIKTPNKNGKKIEVHGFKESEIEELEMYFNPKYFNENKENIISKQEHNKEFVKTQCNKAYDFLKLAEECLNKNEFDNASKYIEDANDVLYEPWREGAVNIEYIYSVSINPKKDLITSKILSKCEDLRTELYNKKKKYETERVNNILHYSLEVYEENFENLIDTFDSNASFQNFNRGDIFEHRNLKLCSKIDYEREELIISDIKHIVWKIDQNHITHKIMIVLKKSKKKIAMYNV